MRTRKNLSFCKDRTDLIERPAINPLTGLDDVAADNRRFRFLERRFERLAAHRLLGFFG